MKAVDLDVRYKLGIASLNQFLDVLPDFWIVDSWIVILKNHTHPVETVILSVTMVWMTKDLEVVEMEQK